MTRFQALTVTALLAGLPSVALEAQTPGRDHAVLEIPSSTAAMAMGDAFDLSGQDSDGIFYNPATLARAEGFVLGLQRFREAGSQATVSAAAEWWNGRVGVGLQMMEWGVGAEPRLGGLGRILAGGELATAEWAASAGYAQELFGPAVGVVAKLVGRRYGAERDVIGAFDLGVAHEVGPAWLGVSARNLTFDALAGDEADRVPERVALGAGASGFEVGPLDLGGAARLTRLADGEVQAGGGLEVAYWPVVGRTFIGRVGVQTEPHLDDDVTLTFGAAFHGDDLVLEYAYRPVDLLGDGEGLHRISIGWR